MFVEMGLSVNGAIIGVIGASMVGLIMSRFFIRPPVFSGATFPVRRLLGFSAPVFMSSLSLRMLRLDVIALKVLGATAAQVGFYSAGQSLSIHTSLLSGALSPPLLSTLSRLIRQGDESKAKDIGRTAMRLVIWLLPFAAMTAGAATEIVDLVFGKEFVSAGPILAYLIFAAVGFIGITMARAIILAIGRPGWTFLVTGPMFPIAVIGYLILIPWMGGVGAAIVTTCATCLAAVASFLAVYKLWGILP
ncbi:MAG: oligosaccharide flippase family protein, partial [Deltaproteobacteria bacterium]|nr:oligosaccharide flippase family protein [Deltaproteobacteria bacterium]